MGAQKSREIGILAKFYQDIIHMGFLEIFKDSKHGKQKDKEGVFDN